MEQQISTMPWEVVSVDETTLFDKMVGPKPALRINFKLADGTHSYVITPKEKASPDDIKQQIHEAATLITQLLTLESNTAYDQSGNPVYLPPPAG